MATQKPIGTVTRGTTNPNRLRRVDRFIAALPVLKSSDVPIVVDLGFGASPITAIELLERLSKVNAKTRVVGIEIDRERVERGLAVAHENLLFGLGGFETPLPSPLPRDSKVQVIRAFNVLRQYDESEVPAAWALMQSRLSVDGWLIEGTCDEIGRLSSWVAIDSAGPQTLTIAMRLASIGSAGLEMPSAVAERLPKALIHRNLTGERIHDFLTDLDASWQKAVGLAAFGATQRWMAACEAMQVRDWPIRGNRKRWRLGELTVDWQAVKPD